MSIRIRAVAACLIASALFSRFGIAAAADPATVLAPFVNDDTFAAGFVNLAALPKDQNAGLLDILPLPRDEVRAWSAAIQPVEQLIGQLREAGLDEVYLLGGLADIRVGGSPLAVLRAGGGSEPEKVADVLRNAGAAGPGKELELRPHGPEAVIVGTPTTLGRYASLTKSNRPDLLGPLDKLSQDGAVVAAVVCPGPDFRRVIRELWPELPGPLAPLRGELADRWLHLELSASLSPHFHPRLTLQARDEQAAKVFAQLWRDLPNAVPTMNGEAKPKLTKQTVQAVVEALPAKVDGNRVTLEFPTKEAELAALQSLASRAADAALESSRRHDRMNQFKHLAIAMHNYHDVNKHFPDSAAIRSKDGKPLLSWRVALLPYLDEGELFKQFHLEEPWDSAHNRTLIEKMPEIFADPDRKLRHLAREGKTTYQVPVGPETVFPGHGGITFRDIADGTSKTIMFVEVEPLRAVVWTKPEDWEPDMENALRGVARSDRDIFVAAWCDGSVQAVAVAIDPGILRAMLTRAGREVINRP